MTRTWTTSTRSWTRLSERHALDRKAVSSIYSVLIQNKKTMQCGASCLRVRNAVCSRSLPCVKLVNVGSTRRRPGRDGDRDRPLKPVLQKRLKKRTDCGGKHLGCSWEANQGLQCGLSGNRVVRSATARLGTERGTASIGNERCSVGKTNPHLSRKIYLICCR